MLRIAPTERRTISSATSCKSHDHLKPSQNNLPNDRDQPFCRPPIAEAITTPSQLIIFPRIVYHFYNHLLQNPRRDRGAIFLAQVINVNNRAHRETNYFFSHQLQKPRPSESCNRLLFYPHLFCFIDHHFYNHLLQNLSCNRLPFVFCHLF